jgi:hypothetical protein
VRIAFFILLAMNVVYLAWAGWIDTPPAPPPVNEANAKLQQLTLVSDEAAESTQLARPVPDSGPAAQTVPAVANASSSRSTSPGRCVSVGPFNDLAHVARGAALLRDRGFNPQQRAEQGETWEGYWVYVGGLKSPAEETKVVKTLERAGITDAHVMPEAEGGRRVSIGLFSERDRAEKRAQAVKRLGFTPEITERKQPGTLYWVDLDLGTSERTVPTEGLLSLEDAGSHLEIRVCPGPSSAPAPVRPLPRDSRPAATTADAGLPTPG